jgi:Zn-dependent protease
MSSLTPDALVLGLLAYIVFLFSTTCHEASHAFIAKIGGDPTAFHGGQVSLNPLPHIRREPFGMVVVPLLSVLFGGGMIGWASAPYDPAWQQKYPRRAAWMSLAGPAANAALVLVAAVLIHAGIAAGVFRAPDRLNSYHIVEAVGGGLLDPIASMVSILFSLNLLLGIFNLLPLPPLDGFSVLGIFMPDSIARRWGLLGLRIRAYSIIGLLVGWELFEKIYGPIFWKGVQLLYPNLSYH